MTYEKLKEKNKFAKETEEWLRFNYNLPKYKGCRLQIISDIIEGSDVSSDTVEVLLYEETQNGEPYSNLQTITIFDMIKQIEKKTYYVTNLSKIRKWKGWNLRNQLVFGL